MEIEYKKSQVLDNLDLKIYKDNVLIIGIGTQPILTLSNDKIDKDMNFSWFMVGYGSSAFTIDTEIELKDNVILTDFPTWRIIIEDNKETINNYKDLFINLSKFDRNELNNRNKECGRVLIKEYFLVPSYMITASHSNLKLDSYVEKTKANLKAVVKESGIVLA